MRPATGPHGRDSPVSGKVGPLLLRRPSGRGRPASPSAPLGPTASSNPTREGDSIYFAESYQSRKSAHAALESDGTRSRSITSFTSRGPELTRRKIVPACGTVAETSPVRSQAVVCGTADRASRSFLLASERQFEAQCQSSALDPTRLAVLRLARVADSAGLTSR